MANPAAVWWGPLHLRGHVGDGLDRFRESHILLRRVGEATHISTPHTGGQKPNLTDPALSAWEPDQSCPPMSLTRQLYWDGLGLAASDR